ncbi:hypothetical protein J4409_01775 [Candidatus Woesearchaeota archaeon]|nr:hypothetical protein [Candidatus Woesearchaeota archaeon]
MQRVLLRFKNIEAKPDVHKNDLRLLIQYEENGLLKSIDKVLLAGDDVDKFVSNMLKDIKTSAKNKYVVNSNDILDGFVNVVIDENDDGETEERIIGGLKRLRERLKGFKSINSADNYMNRFHDMSKLEVRL